jgi:D-ribose pyranase
MLKQGIVNPAINHLLSRVRHTNTLLIADIGFPTISGIEVVDVSVIAGLPRVLDLVAAVLAEFRCGRATMALEFTEVQHVKVQQDYKDVLDGIDVAWMPHKELKQRVLQVVGIIRTGDTTRFGNVLLESA